ncbi:hypothetical protein KIN20_035123 [Parelaphostrongylus tenuis]|uniref:Uncharacterized protein n=1 Tax=Parelaphostrongylus tenuis TaxID=148309 RepID=A0AAD5RB49_PARTN|nr:hypothetical protein KIN20_035123 [Parelaphostrongylus tenuis]
MDLLGHCASPIWIIQSNPLDRVKVNLAAKCSCAERLETALDRWLSLNGQNAQKRSPAETLQRNSLYESERLLKKIDQPTCTTSSEVRQKNARQQEWAKT